MFWFLRLRRLFSTAGREALILWYAFRNPATPRAVKAGSLLLFLYLLSPIDILPDFALLFGWADDLAILLMGIPFLVNKLPPDVLAEAAERADQRLGRSGRSGRRPAGAR
jgi:uncharacterized membrane protein YkvA (DUF1232 family)